MSSLPLAPLGLLAYTYVGYPLAIGILARVAPLETIRDPEHSPMVSVLLPAFNVEAYLDAKLDSLLALDYPADKLEILIYDDCSTDKTAEIIARRAAAEPRIRPLKAESRGGKPTGLNRMREVAAGDVLLMTDSRQPLARGALRALVQHFADPTVGAVSGNLVLEGEAGAGVYWKYENWIREQEAKFRSMVGVTGPIYAIRRELLRELPADIILDDLYTPMRVRLDGKRVLFEKDAVATDLAFDDDREFGRKARTLAGNYQLFARMPELLIPVLNPSWFETFSHKILRLAGPWMLGGLAAASVRGAMGPSIGRGASATWICRGLVAGQTGFYLLAAAGPRAGRFGAVARTFVMMNSAALVGLGRFVRGAQRITW